MWQMLRKRIGARDGFTLIELVVVVAILGILAVIVTPKVMGAIDNAKTNSFKSSAKQIQVAMERYYAEQGAYPVPATVCGNNYSATAPSGCTLAELKGALGNYVNLDSANLDATDPVNIFTVDTVATPNTYVLKLNFKEGTSVKLITIQADSIVVP